MKRGGVADLPLHHGRVPPWLADRMRQLGGAIIESIATDYGKAEVLKRLADPFWFQALGCVLGMDWHSSGITTSVMGALKKAINPMASDLGLHVCGGRGRHSRRTPDELLVVADRIGLNGHELVRCSKLSAKIDNTAIQDGFQLYLHNFIVSDTGEWAVVQQGMHQSNGYARRYHWHSEQLASFVEEPHTSIYGRPQGLILNTTAKEAAPTRKGVLEIAGENPDKMVREVQRLILPAHHDVRAKDVNLKRLGTILALAKDRNVADFESLVLLEGLGPRTLQSLVMVSEVIHGTPSRFDDPARFSFAHGGKDGHPFPVPTKVYDETIEFLRDSLTKARIGRSDKKKAMDSLSKVALQLEPQFTPQGNLDELIEQERRDSWKYGGRTVMDWAQPPAKELRPGDQMTLF